LTSICYAIPMQESTVRTAPNKKLQSLDVRGLLEELVLDGYISKSDGKRMLMVSRAKDLSKIHPLIAIADQRPADHRYPGRTIQLENLVEWLAGKAGMTYERIDPLKLDVTALTRVISYAYASARKILPLRATRDTAVIATSDPFSNDWHDELSQMLRKDIVMVLANPRDIVRYTDEFYGLAKSLQKATRRDTPGSTQLIQNLEQLVELGRTGNLDAESHHVVHIVDWLLQFAFEQRASDIHLEPRRDQAFVRFRIDGVLHRVYEVPVNVMNAIVGRIKTLGRMDIAEKRRPLDGRLKTKTPNGQEIELRLSTVPTALGEKMVMRIFDPEVLRRDHEQLGLSEQELAIWQDLVGQPHGIVLVTGPTGSGKTTTLYSTLRQIASPDINVCTVEDPIEMIEPMFNQMQVHASIDLTFAAGIRALLRQDPDVIMVGEIRDLETADMAVQAALTGHLVLSTLHTNDSAAAITRLLEVGIPAYLINATLLGVVAQRLIRTLCPHCKKKQNVDAAAWKNLTRPWKVPLPNETYVQQGCLDCRNTGYLGRVGLYEMLRITPELRALVTADTDVASIREQGIKQGMQPLRISGARKIAGGITTMSEVMRVIPRTSDSE
jgi:general secretion pathway protein E